MRVLLISPARSESAFLGKALRESAHSVQATDDLRDGLYLGSLEPFDTVLVVAIDEHAFKSLDGLLPSFAKLPGSPAVIVIMSAVTARERAKALRAGADACFVTPYSIMELQERMRALRRGAVAAPTDSEAHQTIRLEPATRELVEGKRRICIGKREFLLIECLLRQANLPVPRDELIRYAWPEKESVDPASVNLIVVRLRKKLEEHGFAAQLDTVNRYGYQLRAL
ncbi:response regulator transcription factor [Caballeronia sp. LZ034LL]|uniref:response regulator transcription factor n=1 Tax=Caballeronia sp. LZ034LL TaxID=3038567 RepID=UPI00285FB1C5|nr:response regulator transcription factor [Caballeronia sp. LZ034LL]MDR5835128.1 response regulator transcription factor [Caballeronia sp. LZ034LL]